MSAFAVAFCFYLAVYGTFITIALYPRRKRPAERACCDCHSLPSKTTISIESQAPPPNECASTVAYANCPVCTHRVRSTVLLEIGDLTNECSVELFACERCGVLIASEDLGAGRQPTTAEIRLFRRGLPRAWGELERKQRDYRNRLRHFAVVSSLAPDS